MLAYQGVCELASSGLVDICACREAWHLKSATRRMKPRLACCSCVDEAAGRCGVLICLVRCLELWKTSPGGERHKALTAVASLACARTCDFVLTISSSWGITWGTSNLLPWVPGSSGPGPPHAGLWHSPGLACYNIHQHKGYPTSSIDPQLTYSCTGCKALLEIVGDSRHQVRHT